MVHLIRYRSDEPSHQFSIPLLPDGSRASLPIDQSAGNEHQLNCHGWPPNNIQEYANSESQQLKDLFLKNIEIQKAALDPNSTLSDIQKAALCPSRTAQTFDEFARDAMRIDKVREWFEKPADIHKSQGSERISFKETDLDQNELKE